MVSKHYTYQRNRREDFIEKILGEGHIVDGFIVDKGHYKGAECHSITDNGIIIVHNLTTGKLVTKLIARPPQIKRYYEYTGRKPPSEYEDILRIASKHEKRGYHKL